MHKEYHLQTPAFTVENIDMINVIRNKNYRHSYRNGRGKYGFIYVVSGSITDYFLDERIGTITAKAGDLLFIPKGSAYTGLYTEDRTEIKIVQFDLASGSLPHYLSSPKKLALPHASERIRALFKHPQQRVVDHPFYSLSCLYELLWQIDENEASMPRKYRKLQSALSEIAEHVEQNESVSYYASLCDMSEVNFRRLFREYTGFSPIEYRNDLRLKNAQGMLQSGEYNVSEAAEACGFSNLSFFIRLYKKKFGYTPKKE